MKTIIGKVVIMPDEETSIYSDSTISMFVDDEGAGPFLCITQEEENSLVVNNLKLDPIDVPAFIDAINTILESIKKLEESCNT